MKTIVRVIVLLVVLAACCWIGVGLLHYHYHEGVTLTGSLTFGVPAHVTYTRFLILAFFVIAGVVIVLFHKACVRVMAELQGSERRYRNLFENSPIALWVVDFSRVKKFVEALRQSGIVSFGQYFDAHPDVLKECAGLIRVIDVNETTLKLFRAKDKARVLENIREMFYGESVDSFKTELLCMLSGKTSCGFEGTSKTFDGGRISVSGTWSVAPGYERTYGKVFVSFNDITRRKQAEEALRESEERYRRLSEATIEGVAVHDQGVIVDTNQTFATMFGYDVDELIGRQGLDLLAPESRDIAGRHLEGGIEEPYEAIGLRKDGTTFPMEVLGKASPYKGRMLRMAAVRDISERRQAELERQRLQARMQHAQKLESLGVLAGGIAHDFNNLLMGILGNADLALIKLPPESLVSDNLRQIVTVTMRAAELTKQMLAYSGRGKFVVEAVNLSRLVEEMTHLLEVSISKKVVLRYNFADELPAIEGDPTQLCQVVMNLITNASEAIGEKRGAIAVTTGVTNCTQADFKKMFLREDLKEGQYVYLEVVDTGCGMEAEKILKIFDPFYTTKFTGRGLGLAAVLGIVRGHNGTLEVRSKVGRGTTFRVLLPAAGQMVSRVEREEKAAEAWHATGTILVVDDEETVREVAGKVLERAGFSVITAGDGREGVDLFRKHADEIKLVLLDVTMPEMNGEEAFREMRKIRPEVPVILSSGYNEQEATNCFAGKGLAGFIQKPYKPQNLLDKLRLIVENV